MQTKTVTISPVEMAEQMAFCAQIAAQNAQLPRAPLALVSTYGCQQNEADSERLRGYLAEMGYAFTHEAAEADLVIFNTCAVREHAEQRVLGNVGALTHTKRANPNQIICLCGCMMQQAQVAEKVKQSYHHVDLVFGPNALWRFPSLLLQLLQEGGRIFDADVAPDAVVEGVPLRREGGIRAWVSVMYGCNNFCSYCIVPYVRGRERSRASGEIFAEVKALVGEGYKEITLLGQNVNSYGKDLAEGHDFAWLLEQVNAISGDFVLRFMTSHPKDATPRLFAAMARCEKVAPQLHLPFQAGNDRVLAAMNRGYTRAQYLALVEELRRALPNVVLTSDIIVGFPGETTAEFEDTLRVLEAVRFDALFTFIYSPRTGTPAAELPDPLPKVEKSANFQRLLDVQNKISAEKQAEYVGKTLRCLVDGTGSDARNNLTARTLGGRLVHLCGPENLVGQYANLRITSASTWALFGELA